MPSVNGRKLTAADYFPRKYRYHIAGSGKQARSIAYDLSHFGQAKEIVFSDFNLGQAEQARRFLQGVSPECRVKARQANAVDVKALVQAFAGADVVISALPYSLNHFATFAALEAGASYCDLGMAIKITDAQHAMNDIAISKGVTIVPDCGLAPGLVNLVAAEAVRRNKKAKHVKIYCGGLPAKPTLPMGWLPTWSTAGLLFEYSGQAEILRDGRIQHVPALEGEEMVITPGLAFDVCEARFTTGATSTAPRYFLDRLQTYEYRTLRYAKTRGYPGHWDFMKIARECGLLDENPMLVTAGTAVIPRQMFAALMDSRLKTDGPNDDLVFVRVVCTDEKGKGEQIEITGRANPKLGFTAMEKTTGFPTAMIAHALASHRLPCGTVSVESIPDRDAKLGDEIIQGLKSRGIKVSSWKPVEARA